MNPRTLELLEYKKVQEMLAAQTDTPMGKSLARNAYPVGVRGAKELQKVGREVEQAISTTSSPSIREVPDVRVKVSGAMQGVILTGVELRDILMVLNAFDTVSTWIGRLATDFINLHRIREMIPRLPFLVEKLARTVDDQGVIKDSASEKLGTIRGSMRQAQERLRKRAEDFTRQRSFADYLQEPIVTIRNGRYVLPIKQEYASKVPGIIHDQSASGQTVFLEPSELVEMANQLRRLELMERDEVDRILTEVSESISESGHEILEGIEALGQFDLGMAKARLVSKWNGSFPTLKEQPGLSLVKAWHPLLRDEPVPMDLSLDESERRTIVITGPNMGGKTVALKTAGLLVCMALAGLPCPCDRGTEIGDIQDILCDIGDEQSIEENLSTFSAHMENIRNILIAAGPGKLVLIDELGAGTDPKEGAALAQAILTKIHESGALCIVTSHYGELKVMAQKTPGMSNASMEWDPVNMVPTFRLVLGRPGRSNAFLVAKRLGLDDDVLTMAREYMQEDVVRLEDVIAEMEVASQTARMEAQRASSERALSERLRAEYENKLASLERERKKIINDAKREAKAVIMRARAEFERSLDEIRQAQSKTLAEVNAKASEIRGRLREAQGDMVLDEEDDVPGEPVTPDELEPGLQVRVIGFSEPAIVLESPTSLDRVLVQVGDFKLRVDIGQLRSVDSLGRRKRMSAPRVYLVSSGESKPISSEIDLRGMTKEEAWAVLDKYLDDAFMASLPQVRIIHGKGTGVLRKAVEEYLDASTKYVDSYRIGEPSEGGTGVTVVKLKR